MGRAAQGLALSGFACIVACTLQARALEPGKLGDEEVHLDITDASSVLLNWTTATPSRSTCPAAPTTGGACGTTGSTSRRAGASGPPGYAWTMAGSIVRLIPETIALDVVQTRPAGGGLSDATLFRQKFNESGGELSNRYINWLYPAKYYVGYSTRDIEVTGGDFYASLGRGFVLSVRKLDELSSDTTVRGARVTGRINAGPLKTRLTVLGGEMNPLRIDESSGRYIGVDGSVTPSSRRSDRGRTCRVPCRPTLRRKRRPTRPIGWPRHRWNSPPRREARYPGVVPQAPEPAAHGDVVRRADSM